MPDILTGQDALDWIKNNPITDVGDGTIDKYTQRDRGLLGTIFSPVQDLINKAAESKRYADAMQSGTSYQPKYLTADEYTNMINNPIVDVGKSAVGSASYFVPGAMGLKGAALAGGMYGLSDSKTNNLSDLLTSTATGAAGGFATGAALKGAGKLVGKLANKGAGGATNKIASNAGKDIDIDSIYNQLGKEQSRANEIFTSRQAATLGVKGTKDIIDKPQVLLDNQRILNSLGEKNTEKGIKNAIGRIAEQRNGVIEQAYKNNPINIVSDDLLSGLSQSLNDVALNSSKNITREELQAGLKNFISQSKFGTIINEVEGKKTFALPDLNQIAVELKTQIRNATKSAKEGPLMQAKQVLLDDINNKLGQAVPEYNKYNTVMSSLYKSQEATGRKTLNALNGNTSGGLGKSIIGEMIPAKRMSDQVRSFIGKKGLQLTGNFQNQVAQPSKISRFTNKIVNNSIADRIAPILKNPVVQGVTGAKLADQLLGGNTNSQLPQYDTNILGFDPAVLGYPADPTVNPQTGDNGMSQVPLRDALLAKRAEIAQKFLSQTDSKGNPAYTPTEALKEANSLMEMLGMPVPNNVQTKPLSAEASKVISNAESGLRSISTMRDILSKNKSTLFTSNLPNIIRPKDARVLETARKNVSDIVGRLRSGAAINDDETKKFLELLPTTFDDPDTIDYKFNELEYMFNDVADRIRGGSTTNNQDTNLSNLLLNYSQ